MRSFYQMLKWINMAMLLLFASCNTPFSRNSTAVQLLTISRLPLCQLQFRFLVSMLVPYEENNPVPMHLECLAQQYHWSFLKQDNEVLLTRPRAARMELLQKWNSFLSELLRRTLYCLSHSSWYFISWGFCRKMDTDDSLRLRANGLCNPRRRRSECKPMLGGSLV